MVFCQTGGVSKGGEKTILLFWKKYFIRIVLGPQKHVFSCSGVPLSTDIRTALKVARGDKIPGKEG